MSIKENKIYEVVITSYTHDGLGVGKVDGFPLFIKGAIFGETLKVRVTKLKKNLGFADIASIVEKSSGRVKPECDCFNECGGCSILHMNYEKELEFKNIKVQDAFKSFDSVKIKKCLGSSQIYHYRNKVQVPIAYDRDRNIITGFYSLKSHNIVPNNSCLLQSEQIGKVIAFIKKLCEEYNYSIYDETKHRGLFRHIIIRENNDNKLMLILVVTTKKIKNLENFVNAIQDEFENIINIGLNINSRKTNVILGEENVSLFEKEKFYDRIGDFKFDISANSFFQINKFQTKNLYDTVVKYANVSKDDTVIDAYCGVGTIGMYISENAKKIYGIEVVGKAIKDAKNNAVSNNINNIEFLKGKTEEVLPKMLEDGIKADVIIVDPPRKGCTPDLLEAIATADVKRIVYVSCNVATLARDLKILNTLGYEVEEVQPVDMFPRTFHVEVVACLSKSK